MKNINLDITEKAIAPLPLAEKGNYLVRDNNLKGFQVVIGKTKKSYIVHGEFWKNNKRQFAVKTKIGEFSTISAREARIKAKEILTLIAKGEKPGNGIVEPIAAAVTLKQAWERYRAAHLERKGRSQKTIDGYCDHIERLFSDWLDTPLADLSNEPMLVTKRHDEITQNNGSYMANASMRTLRAIYNHAAKTHLDLPAKNPARASVMIFESWGFQGGIFVIQ